MPVPNTFANATATIPLSQLDANFATTITLGNTAIQLGNTVTTLNNMTLANVTVSSGNVTITNVSVTTANVTTANIATAQISNVTVSGTGTFAAGSNTAPSITTSGDTNTGIFFPAADTIAFTEGGVESMRINSSGNVGIGTTTPPTGYRLDVSGGRTVIRDSAEGTLVLDDAGVADASTPMQYLSSDGGALIFGNANRTVTGGTTNSTERMRIDSSGILNVLMTGAETGATNGFQFLSPAGNGGLTIYSSAATRDQIQLKDSVTTGPSSGNTSAFGVSSGALYIKTGGSESMRITSAGEVLVGGTTAISAASALSVQKLNGLPEITIFRNDTSIVANDALGQIAFYGNDTTSNTPTRLAYISADASGTHAAGDNPTDLVFGCTPDGSSTVDEFARILAFSVSRVFRLQQPTLSNDTNSEIQAAGGTAGTINRYASLYVRKHSGITNSCGSLYLSSEDAAINYIWADNSDVLRISTTVSNIGTTGGTVVGTQTSDERIKNIIGPITYGLEQIKSINPVEYTLKDDVEQTKRIGFIAQQVQPIVPESVYDTKEVIVEGEPTKLGMEYVSLIPVLVKAMQEQQVMIDELKAKVAALENA